MNNTIQMETDKYVFFFGHKENSLLTHYFSQWYKCNFTNSNGTEFSSAEQYMMYKKALLFGDKEIAQKIINSDDPAEVKALGRKVKNYSESKWNEYKYKIVVRGNKLKFSQNKKLLKRLLETGNKLLVEASPYDKIWGIGLTAIDACKIPQNKWPGQNLLGLALGEVRDSFAK